MVELVPGELVALALADLLSGRPVRRTEAMRWEFLWTFSVRADDGGKTRLVIRERVAFGSRLSQWLMAPMGLVSFVMTRKMMLGIKDRAEALTSSGRLESEAPAGRAGGKVA